MRVPTEVDEREGLESDSPVAFLQNAELLVRRFVLAEILRPPPSVRWSRHTFRPQRPKGLRWKS